MELELFKLWLKESKGMQEASAKDVVSRIRRALKITEINFEKTNEESISELVNSPEFNELSVFVQSQLKRAITLYQEFMLDNSKM
ncbi:hypothetical protein [Neobacillus sp. DY30]|uniref:hypothetical protein n=1 Tax=Neobacillus sp. DY30 TaxID=3047871 RepID=UPI0024BFACD2|nr:hypothetical protein [Neobacillus sp. DY30]WHY01324.1 hypothetical protein QNH29_03475 [Neobacillus sp. DY30]